MRAVLQRVKRASVEVDGQESGSCGAGLLILLGVARGDREEDASRLAEKIAKLRIFADENGKMNRSLPDVGGEVLVISNFTLYAAYAKGNRPDFFASEEPVEAKRLYDFFIDALRTYIPHTESGVFGADMQISCELDGPVTIVMDSEKLMKGRTI